MTVIRKYIADDGKEFDTEYECAEYEEAILQNEFRDTALLFDEEGRPLDLTDAGFEGAWFIKAATDRAAEYMAEKFSNWSNPWQGSMVRSGCWVYTGEDWQEAESFLKIAALLKKIMED